MKKRVLTVDDDPMVRNLTRVILESAEFEVIAVGDAEEAIRFLERDPERSSLSCIILDVQMPGMNGLDLLTRLKLHRETENIPVLMLTCQATDDDVMAGYNTGAEYYITKPFTREQLLYGIRLATGDG